MKLLELEALYALPVVLFLAGLSLLVFVINKDKKVDSWGDAGTPIFVSLTSFSCLFSGLFSMLLLFSFSLCAVALVALLYKENTPDALIYGALGGFTSLIQVWAGTMLFSAGKRILHKEKSFYAAEGTSRILLIVCILCGASLYVLRWYANSHKPPFRYFQEVFLWCVLWPCFVSCVFFAAHCLLLWGTARLLQRFGSMN